MAIPFPTGAVLLFVVDDQDLGGAANLGDLAGDLGFRDIRGADRGILAVIHEQNLVENDRVALFVGARELLDGDGVPFRDRILLASCGDDCEFHSRNTIQEEPEKGNAFPISSYPNERNIDK